MNGGDGDDLMDSGFWSNFSIDTAEELDKYVTDSETGEVMENVTIWFDSQGADKDIEDQWGDSRTPVDDEIILVGVGAGLGLIGSPDDLVDANFNVVAWTTILEARLCCGDIRIVAVPGN